MNGQVVEDELSHLVLLQPSDRCPVCLQEGNPRGETRIGSGATSCGQQSGPCAHCCDDLRDATSADGCGNDAHAGWNAYARWYAYAGRYAHARGNGYATWNGYAGRNAHAGNAHAGRYAHATCGSAANNAVVCLFNKTMRQTHSDRIAPNRTDTYCTAIG